MCDSRDELSFQLCLSFFTLLSLRRGDVSGSPQSSDSDEEEPEGWDPLIQQLKISVPRRNPRTCLFGQELVCSLVN